MDLGGRGLNFARDFKVTFGCFSFSRGGLKGIVFYGTGGTIEQMKEDVSPGKFRPNGYDCPTEGKCHSSVPFHTIENMGSFLIQVVAICLGVTFHISCVDDCKWGEWEVGECSKTCGGGVQTATREKLSGGKPCDEASTEQRECNTEKCTGI